MLLAIITTIAVISWFDLRQIIKTKHYPDLFFFIIIATASIVYGYYFINHILSASMTKILIQLLS